MLFKHKVCYLLQLKATPARDDDDDDGMTPWVGLGSSSASSKPKLPVVVTEVQKQQTAIDITAEDLIPRLTPQNVADLVLLSMVCHLF